MDAHETRKMRRPMQHETMENICFVRDSLLQPNYPSCSFRFYHYKKYVFYIPNFQPSDLAMAPSQPVDVPGIEQPTSSLPYHSEGLPPHQEGQQLLDDFAADGPEPPSFYAKSQMSAHDLYVEQKAEQVAQVIQILIGLYQKIKIFPVRSGGHDSGNSWWMDIGELQAGIERILSKETIATKGL